MSSVVSINFPTAVRQATNGYQLDQASDGTVCACRYDGNRAFTVLGFRAVGNSNFSTVDYCTVELASTTGKLIQYSLRSPIKTMRLYFFKPTPRTMVGALLLKILESRNTKLLSRGNNFVLVQSERSYGPTSAADNKRAMHVFLKM